MKSAQLLVTIGLLWVSQALAQGTGQNGATSASVSPSASPTTPSAASSPSTSPSDTPVPVPMPTPTPPSGTSPPCGDQVVFDQCLRNQDNYVKRCIPKDYACLCRWQQSKVSCYDNCPQDVNKETDVGIATHYCSQPGANATTALPSWTPPTSTLPSASASAPSSAASNQRSDASLYEVPTFFSTFAIVLFLVHWMY